MPKQICEEAIIEPLITFGAKLRLWWKFSRVFIFSGERKWFSIARYPILYPSRRLWRDLTFDKLISLCKLHILSKAISKPLITTGAAAWFVIAMMKVHFFLAWSVREFSSDSRYKVDSALNPSRKLWRDKTCDEHISLLCKLHIFSKTISKPLITIGAAVWFVLALMNVHFFLTWSVDKFISDTEIK